MGGFRTRYEVFICFRGWWLSILRLLSYLGGGGGGCGDF